MHKIPIVIDCDPGVDDVAALILARQLECFDVKAVTTVAGNVKLKHTTRNALRLLEFLGWDIPVGKGAKRPLACKLQTAEEFHGKGGLSGLTLPKTKNKPTGEAAWDVIYKIARENQGELEIVAIGPLTNIAIALAKYPELTGWIRRIVIMGGALLAGNTTPAAEFNICVDPEAAKRVFTCGVPFYLCPLDVTHEGYITVEDLNEISGFGSKEAVFFADIIRPYLALASLYSGGRGAALHDPLALLFAADSSYFTYEECFIGVETQGSITRGKTVTDCYSDKQLDNNGFLVKTVDRDAFIKRVKDLLRKY
jgi:inosine-uridine nucleoside N-ribohydrolase